MPEIIRGPSTTLVGTGARVKLEVDRLTLAKRRWRGAGEDGRDFGFDLEHPLTDGAVFFETESSHYVISQKPERVLEINLRGTSEAARLGWSIGNLHFAIEIEGEKARVVDDPAVRQLLQREGVPFVEATKVFHPAVTTIPHAH